MNILIKGATLLHPEHYTLHPARHQIIWEKKDVLISNGKFKRIADSISNKNLNLTEVIDAKEMALLPSFTNSHTHAAMTLFRGYREDIGFHRWIKEFIWPVESKLTESDVYAGVKLACLEMIKSGTTHFADMYFHWDAIARAVSDMGMKAHIASVFIDGFDPETREHQIAETKRLYEHSNKYKNITFMIGPHNITSVSKESLIWVKNFAKKNKLLVHMHLSQTKDEVTHCKTLYKKRPVAFLKSIGLLNKRFHAIHGIHLTRNEYEIFKKSGSYVINCPSSNAKTNIGLISHEEYNKRNIPILLGTDGPATNNSLDIIKEMKISALFDKQSSPSLIKRCMIDAPKAFDLDCGKVEVGKPADCILVDLNNPAMVPSHDIISNLIFSGDGGCINTTICDGLILMRNRKVKGERKIISDARKSVEKLFKI